MKQHKTCCEVHGMKDGCNQGRLCPERETHPPGWGHPIVLLVVVWTIVLGAGIVTLVRWLLN